jgi:hypothetical protein
VQHVYFLKKKETKKSMQFTSEGGQQGRNLKGTQQAEYPPPKGEYPLYFAFNDETQFSFSHLPELGSRLLRDKSSACTNASTMQAGVFRAQANLMATSTGCVPPLAHPAEQQALFAAGQMQRGRSAEERKQLNEDAGRKQLNEDAWHQPTECAGLNIVF